MIGHEGDQQWLYDQAKAIPKHLKKPVFRLYQNEYENTTRREANGWLRGQLDRFKSVDIPLAKSDELVRLKAERLSLKCIQAIGDDRGEYAYGILKYICDREGVPVDEPRCRPDDENYQVYVHGSVQRMLGEEWWRRRIRIKAKRSSEDLARDFGQVSSRREIYCSNHTLLSRREQRARSAALLELLEAVCVDTGEAVRLSEVAEHALSNPTVRRSELMVRIRGFDDYAYHNGHASEFWTITLPSKYHCNHSGSGERNGRYQDGLTPRVGNQALADTWAKIRAALDRENIRIYGFRVAEPQQDGTPHWHLLLFMEPEHTTRAREIAREYALQEDGNEDGAARYRFDAKNLEQGAGKATGYIAKYIAKNIDGFGVDFDLFGNDAKSAAARVEAWASCWGIRQFQQIGGPPVGVWRELRRLRDGVPLGLDPALRPAWEAANGGDWQGFVSAMGGPMRPRREYPIQLFKSASPVVMGGKTVNQFGEPLTGRLLGIAVGGVPLLTRSHIWKIEVKNSGTSKDAIKEPAQLFAGIRGDAPRGSAGLVSVDGHGGREFPQRKHDSDQYRSNSGRGFDALVRVSGIRDADRRSQAAGIASSSFQEGGAASFPWSSVNNCTEEERAGIDHFKKTGVWPDLEWVKNYECGTRSASRNANPT